MTANLHLEHAEDLMLMMGSNGVNEAFSYIDDLIKTFTSASGVNRNISTKWDGAPAIFCGPDPADGQFFVAKKGLFNKKPILFKSIKEIEDGESRDDLARVFKAVFNGMKPLYDSGKLKDVVQGDFLFHSGTREVKRVMGENCVLFKPQLIAYCIPDHDDLYDAAKACKVCIVIHAKYPKGSAKTVADLSVNFGFDASHLSTKDCLIISPFTSQLGTDVMLTVSEKLKLQRAKTASINLLRGCSKFLDEIASDYDNSWGHSYFIKQYFNARVREGQVVNSASKFFDDYCNYYEAKYRKKIGELKQDRAIAEWKKKFYEGYEYIHDHKDEFVAMVGIYNSIQNTKSIFIPKFEKGERFKTFYYNEEDGTYEIGDQEGYVVVKESTRAVKIVQRLGGFSQRNFNEMKKWTKK
jgi:hypothetical protein